MPKRVLMEEMSWIEYQRRIRDERSMVALPVGALEQHGPHLPLGTDAMIPLEIARRVAERVNLVVSPAFPYGYKSQPRSGGGNHYCGTTSLDGNTLVLALRDVLKEFARHGVRKLVVLNGHYENTMFVIEGIDLALRDLRYDGIGDMTIMRVDYVEFLSEQTLARVFTAGFVGWPLEHAAILETSLMMCLRPELVNIDQIPDDPPAAFPPYDTYPTNIDLIPWHGVLSSAKVATAEKGQLILDEVVAGVAEALQREFHG